VGEGGVLDLLRSIAPVTVHADGRLEHEPIELTWSGRRGRLFARVVRANGSSDAR
jgi:hypothetical protein